MVGEEHRGDVDVDLVQHAVDLVADVVDEAGTGVVEAAVAAALAQGEVEIEVAVAVDEDLAAEEGEVVVVGGQEVEAEVSEGHNCGCNFYKYISCHRCTSVVFCCKAPLAGNATLLCVYNKKIYRPNPSRRVMVSRP